MSKLDLFRRSPLAAPLAANPIVYVDIGSRGGFEDDLLPLAFATQAIGFEPAEAEWARLQTESAGPWRDRRILPHAVSGESGRRTFHIPDNPIAASLLAADFEVTAPFDKEQFFEPREVIEIDTLTLPEALATENLPPPDYLKIDVEGAEWEIIEGARPMLETLSAIKVEVSFLPLRMGHPVAAEMERGLNAAGFQLFDLIGAAHWRDVGHIIHPLSDRLDVPYSKGQLVHGDLLFFRTVETMDFATDAGRHAAFKAAMLAMAFGYFDYGRRILEDARLRDWLAEAGIADPVGAVGALSSAYGRLAFREAFGAHFRRSLTFLRRFSQAFG